MNPQAVILVKKKKKVCGLMGVGAMVKTKTLSTDHPLVPTRSLHPWASRDGVSVQYPVSTHVLPFFAAPLNANPHMVVPVSLPHRSSTFQTRSTVCLPVDHASVQK